MRTIEAVFGFLFGLVALIASGMSFVLSATAGDLVLGMVAGVVAVLGFILGTYLIAIHGAGLPRGYFRGIARKWFWQRWGTSPIRRRVVGWVEAIGLALAHRTVAHMRATIMTLAGEANDLYEITRDLRADLKSAFQRELGLWKQVRALKKAKEACIAQARSWHALANLWRETCLTQEAELQQLRREQWKRERSKRSRYTSEIQPWGQRPTIMTQELWTALVVVVKEFQPFAGDSEINGLAEFLAKLEDQHRKNRRWDGGMTGGIGCTKATCLAGEYPARVTWDDLRKEVDRWFPDVARGLAASNFLFRAMDAAGDAAYIEGREEGRAAGSNFMQTMHGVGTAWDRLVARDK